MTEKNTLGYVVPGIGDIHLRKPAFSGKLTNSLDNKGFSEAVQKSQNVNIV